MRKYDNIVQSETAPNTNSLWIHNGVLKHFNNGAWRLIKCEAVASTEEPASISEEVPLVINEELEEETTEEIEDTEDTANTGEVLDEEETLE